MGGFDLKNLASAGSIVNHIADGAFGTAKNLQDNKTKRIESDNKRRVDTTNAVGNVIGNVGSAAKSFGDAYHSIGTVKSEREKAKAETTKAQAEIKKADAVLEKAKNEKSKNDQEHIKNMHKIDLDHQEVMDRQAKEFDQACKDNAVLKDLVNEHLKESEIYQQKLRDGNLSATETAQSIKDVGTVRLDLAKAILEKRK